MKKNCHVQRRKVFVQGQMMKHFRNYWMYVFLKQWRKTSYTMTQLGKKDSIKGAYLKFQRYDEELKDMRNTITNFDSLKLDVESFEQTKNEFRHNHAYIVYAEMKALFDSTVSNFKKQVAESI